MIPPDQNTLEGSLLCILYEKANGRNHFSSISQIAANFRPPISEERVRVAFDQIVNEGLAEPEAGEGKSYQITHRGIEWIESEFAISFDGENHQFRRRCSGGPLSARSQSKAQVDWSKWGAVAAVATLPVTVILWWFS